MLTLVVELVVAAVALPVAALLVRDAVRRRHTLASLATALVVTAFGAGILVSVFPQQAYQVQSALNVPYHIGLLALLAVYPTGRFVPRWTIVPFALGAATQLGNAASAFTWDQQWWWPWHLFLLWVVLLVGGQLYRFRRRSTAEERQQTTWPLLAVITQMAAFVVLSTLQVGITGSSEGGWAGALAVALNGLAPFGFAVGLLAPGIFRVDRALRAVIAASLVAIVELGVFATAMGVVPLLGVTEGGAGWTGAVLVSVIAWPLGRLGGRVADKLVYGTASDPLVALEELGRHLAAVDRDDIAQTIAGSIGKALALRGVAVEITGGERVEWGSIDATAESSPVNYRGQPLAVILAAPRAAELSLTQGDRELIAHLGRQAAPALHDAKVVGDLVEARARIVLAREDERKRLRRDLHDDLGPTFAGLGLGAEAVRSLTASGDARASVVAEQLAVNLAAATRQLRDIAYDLRPPVLDDKGLVEAIRDRVVVPGAIPSVTVIADDPQRNNLPAAVESAALRIAQEAVANVRRHAAATTCRVAIQSSDTDLVLTIDDDGIGLPNHHHEGIGFRSMRERVDELRGQIEIERLTPGTRIRASLPTGFGGES